MSDVSLPIQTLSEAAIDEFECPVLECYERFTIQVWHCPFCAHHWPMTRNYCANCHQPSIEGEWHLTREAVTARKV